MLVKSPYLPLCASYRESPPDAHVFEHLAKHMDIHSYRRQYTQALYQYYTQGRVLPPVQGRLKRNTYDRDAAERVSWSLGHTRIDVVLRHYLR